MQHFMNDDTDNDSGLEFGEFSLPSVPIPAQGLIPEAGLDPMPALPAQAPIPAAVLEPVVLPHRYQNPLQDRSD